jgi:hypothetical protein
MKKYNGDGGRHTIVTHTIEQLYHGFGYEICSRWYLLLGNML